MTIRPRRGGYQVMVYAASTPSPAGNARSPGRSGQARGRAPGGQAARRGCRRPPPLHQRPHGRGAAGRLPRLARDQRQAPLLRHPQRLPHHRRDQAQVGRRQAATPQLDPVILDRFYGQLRRRGRNDSASLSTSRIRQVHAVLSGALGLAARYGWISFKALRAHQERRRSRLGQWTTPWPQSIRWPRYCAAARSASLTLTHRMRMGSRYLWRASI